MAARGLIATEVAGEALALRWADGMRRLFHPRWLRDNCPSARHPGTRQKTVSAAELPAGLAVASASATAEAVRVTWHPDGHVSEFCSRWLRAHAHPDPVSDEASRSAAAPVAAPVAPAVFEFDVLMREAAADEAGPQGSWIASLAKHGAVLVRGVPPATADGVDGVRAVAELIGPLQPTIYGTTFEVRSEEGAINLAYTSEELAPHMDLVYYESPPGMQLLHCLEFGADVQGGQTFLLDGVAIAEALRASHPAAFETLRTVPATFLKDHAARADPVFLSYQRPHIATDPHGRVIGLFWAPPFEGPLRVPMAQVGAYYEAYQLLHDAVASAPR